MLRQIDAALARALPEPHRAWSAGRTFTLAEPFARVPMETAVNRAAEKTGIAELAARRFE